MRKNTYLVGMLLVAVGVIILVLRMFGIKVFELDTSDFWVFIVLIIGLTFELSYFLTRRNPGLLIPGGIITTIALLFMFETATNWNFSQYTWPVYIFAVAVGLFQMYFFSNREKGLLIASMIVGGISVLFMAMMVMESVTSIVSLGVLIPVALIAAGIALVASGKGFKN